MQLPYRFTTSLLLLRNLTGTQNTRKRSTNERMNDIMSTLKDVRLTALTDALKYKK